MAPNSVLSVRVIGTKQSPEPNQDLLSSIDNLQDLIARIPSCVRASFTPVLHAYTTIWTKIHSVQGHLVRLQEHLTKGDFPPKILHTTKVPTIQFLKEVPSDTAIKANFATAMESAVTNARKAIWPRISKPKRKRRSTCSLSPRRSASKRRSLMLADTQSCHWQRHWGSNLTKAGSPLGAQPQSGMRSSSSTSTAQTWFNVSLYLHTWHATASWFVQNRRDGKRKRPRRMLSWTEVP